MGIKLSIIVAMSENRCVGKDNEMPWHISDDLRRFKALTMGHPVVMGRKTYESIMGYLNKPLPGRDNIVVSRSGFKDDFHVPVFVDIASAVAYGKDIAEKKQLEEIFIIGGAQIYTQCIQAADRLYMTQVHQTVEGDAFFPEFDLNEWAEIDRKERKEHDPPYSFITYERK